MPPLHCCTAVQENGRNGHGDNNNISLRDLDEYENE